MVGSHNPVPWVLSYSHCFVLTGFIDLATLVGPHTMTLLGLCCLRAGQDFHRREAASNQSLIKYFISLLMGVGSGYAVGSLKLFGLKIKTQNLDKLPFYVVIE